MICPNCNLDMARVNDTRYCEKYRYIRRRYKCLKCGHKFTTLEKIVPDTPKRKTTYNLMVQSDDTASLLVETGIFTVNELKFVLDVVNVEKVLKKMQ